MKTVDSVKRALALAVFFATMTACTGNTPSNTNQRSSNAGSGNAVASNVSQANRPQSKASQQPASSTTGTIEVTSVPAGAKVLLIFNDEGGAGEPQSKGLTPATITGVEPGKYTLDLEKPGYKFFQKVLVVKAGQTAKVNATLRKQ